MMTLMGFLTALAAPVGVKRHEEAVMDKQPIKKLQNIARRYEREIILFGKEKKSFVEKLQDVIHNADEQKMKLQRREKKVVEKTIGELREMIKK